MPPALRVTWVILFCLPWTNLWPVLAANTDSGRILGYVQDRRINEVSGMVAGRRNSGILWVHNDSGDRPRVYAIDLTGRLRSIVTLKGVTARDWEDIAVGPGPKAKTSYLYIGDIGDNAAQRPSVIVYRLPEPAIDPNAPVIETSCDSLKLRYPDGPHDAETLLVDPIRKDIYLLTKRDRRGRLYRAAWPQSTDTPNTLEFVGELASTGWTGGDVSPDGRAILARGYIRAALWRRDPARLLHEALLQTPVHVPIAMERMGEAICFSQDGRRYFTLTEGQNQPIRAFDVPRPKGAIGTDLQP